ncbi:MAG: DUF6702 family protein [Crocinitomicaceae bacterium]
MKKIIIFVFLAFMSLPLLAHKHYMSIANLEYNKAERLMEVSLKLTAHDFEHILENHFKKRIHIENVADSSKVGQFIISYLKKHIQLTSVGQKAQFNYIGKEVTLRDELFFYFTFKKVLDPSHIILQNSILFSLFSKQQNLMHYKRQSVTKSVTCTKTAPSGEIKFEK